MDNPSKTEPYATYTDPVVDGNTSGQEGSTRGPETLEAQARHERNSVRLEAGQARASLATQLLIRSLAFEGLPRSGAVSVRVERCFALAEEFLLQNHVREVPPSLLEEISWGFEEEQPGQPTP